MSAKPKGEQRVRKGGAIYSTAPPPSGQVHPTYQEGPKHGNGGQEVPDVMIIKEVKEDAVTVVFPGLCGGFLAKGQGQQPTDSAVARPGPTPLRPTPWHPPPVPGRKHSEPHSRSPATMTGSILCISLIFQSSLQRQAGGWEHSFHSESPTQLPPCSQVTSGCFCPKYYIRPYPVPKQQWPWLTLQILPALPTPLRHKHFLTLYLEQPVLRPQTKACLTLCRAQVFAKLPHQCVLTF